MNLKPLRAVGSALVTAAMLQGCATTTELIYLLDALAGQRQTVAPGFANRAEQINYQQRMLWATQQQPARVIAPTPPAPISTTPARCYPGAQWPC